ncbi:MAG: beta-lactamase domain protein [Gemmatimonadetes bacterium]|nr:beta-lactamase domain protein [Gemmatimonadota bacterium]
MKIDVRTVGAFAENCYLAVDEASGHAVLVDPGDDGARIIEMVKTNGASLNAIWLTHAHLDHIGAINAVRAVYDVPVYLHPLDLPYYERLSAKAADMYGVPWDQPEAATRPLAEGDMLSVGSTSFIVMHVPGHAPGHVSFNAPGVSLSGDLLFAGSIGRTDLPLADPYAMDASLERFATLPVATAVYPGHGPSTTIGQELETNPFLSGRARALKR